MYGLPLNAVMSTLHAAVVSTFQSNVYSPLPFRYVKRKPCEDEIKALECQHSEYCCFRTDFHLEPCTKVLNWWDKICGTTKMLKLAMSIGVLVFKMQMNMLCVRLCVQKMECEIDDEDTKTGPIYVLIDTYNANIGNNWTSAKDSAS